MAHKMNVTFYLGPASGLDERRLTITRQDRAGDDNLPSAASDQQLSGETTFVTVALDINTIWQAKLVDTKTTGEVSVPKTFHFQTADLQFPGPGRDQHFYVYGMEDLSSSSSSSSQSSSSSSSVSSSSSQSSSSQSSSSQSSSSSSQSTSSSSSSSSSQSS